MNKTIAEIIYVGDDIKKPTYPHGFEIFKCKTCLTPLDEIAMSKLKESYSNVRKTNENYTQYYLASRHAGSPDYFSPLIQFDCPKCAGKLVAVFYHKYRDTYFPLDARECRIALINGAFINSDIDGVFERDECQVVLQKLLMRWTFLFEMVYVAVPFIGNQWQSAEERLDLLAEFISCLDPGKTLWVTKPTTLSQIETDFDKDQGDGVFKKLKDLGKMSPLIINAFAKNDFHAKFYAGVGIQKAEALIGSHNLHGGTSLENISFRDYNWSDFLSRYIAGLGVIPIKNGIEKGLVVTYFEEDGDWVSAPIPFERAPENAILEFIARTFYESK